MKYYVYDVRYESDNNINALYGTNKRHEAIKVADDVGKGSIVIRRSDKGERQIYVSPYKSDLGLGD